jgi:hypothetical protein
MSTDLGLNLATQSEYFGDREWTSLGCELAILADALANIARDLMCMGQSGVGEFLEDTGIARAFVLGACMDAVNVVQQVPQQVAGLLAASGHSGFDIYSTGTIRWTEVLESAQFALNTVSKALCV